MTPPCHRLASLWKHILLAPFLLLGAWQLQLQPASAQLNGPASQMVESINNVRAEAGRPPLTEHGTLREVAVERSEDMAERQYFSHTTPEGVDVFVLLDQRGVGYRIAGENLAWNTGQSAESAAIAMRAFLASPPHRANLLRAEFSQVGVGVASDGSKLIFTLLFIG